MIITFFFVLAHIKNIYRSYQIWPLVCFIYGLFSVSEFDYFFIFRVVLFFLLCNEIACIRKNSDVSDAQTNLHYLDFYGTKF